MRYRSRILFHSNRMHVVKVNFKLTICLVQMRKTEINCGCEGRVCPRSSNVIYRSGQHHISVLSIRPVATTASTRLPVSVPVLRVYIKWKFLIQTKENFWIEPQMTLQRSISRPWPDGDVRFRNRTVRFRCEIFAEILIGRRLKRSLEVKFKFSISKSYFCLSGSKETKGS